MVRDKILILEDDEKSRTQLVEIFRDQFKILEASNETQGVDILRKHAASIVVILVNTSKK